QLAREIARIENVYEVYIISGEWDLLLKVRGKDMEEIGKLILDKIRAIEGVGKTVTCTCFSVVKEEI
ncbi:MAG: Lrp/AsnC ligand binding domain-containing protein, partial [Candidatus Thermoplasmatota archaeon]